MRFETAFRKCITVLLRVAAGFGAGQLRSAKRILLEMALGSDLASGVANANMTSRLVHGNQNVYRERISNSGYGYVAFVIDQAASLIDRALRN